MREAVIHLSDLLDWPRRREILDRFAAFDCIVLFRATEDIDPASSGNDDAPDSTDPVMQWGVRLETGGIDVQRDQEAARCLVDYWTLRGVPCTVVSRICGPWTPGASGEDT